MLPLLFPFNFLFWTTVPLSSTSSVGLLATFCPCGGMDIYCECATPSHNLLLAGYAVAGKDVSLSTSVPSLSHSTRAHDEHASRINHHRLDLRQFSWAVRNSVTWANGHVSITLSNFRLFVSYERRIYFVTGLCLSPFVDMIPYACIKMNIRPKKIPFNLHYRYFTNGCVFSGAAFGNL